MWRAAAGRMAAETTRKRQGTWLWKPQETSHDNAECGNRVAPAENLAESSSAASHLQLVWSSTKSTTMKVNWLELAGTTESSKTQKEQAELDNDQSRSEQ